MKKILKEQLYLSSTNPIKVRRYDYKHFTYPWHFHTEYELIYVDEGEGQCLIGDGVLGFNDRTLLLFGTELPHCMQNQAIYKEENALRVKGIIIQFEKDFMQYSFAHYVQFAQIHQLLILAHQGIRFQLKDNPEIVDELNLICSYEGVDQIVHLLQLLQALAVLPRKEFASSLEYNLELAGFKDNKIEKVISFLNRHYTRDIKLDEIAEYAAMNPTAFCRYFKSKTGKTFKEYIIAMRISYACKLLLMDDMTISQVSSESGFESISHFNRCFKEVMNTTPSLYREKMK